MTFDLTHVSVLFATLASIVGIVSTIASRTPVASWLSPWLRWFVRQETLIQMLATAQNRLALAEQRVKDASMSLQFASFTRAEADHLKKRTEDTGEYVERLETYIAALDAYSLRLEEALKAAGITLPPGRPLLPQKSA